MHEQKIARSYRTELFVALAVYIVLLFGSIRLGRPMPEGLARTLVLVSPMIGFGLMIRSIVRHVARVDEYVRVRLLETIALSAAITGWSRWREAISSSTAARAFAIGAGPAGGRPSKPGRVST